MFRRARSVLYSLLVFLAVGLASCADEAPSPVEAPDDPSTVIAVSECTLDASDAQTRARIDGLQTEVDALAAAGTLNDGQARALTNHLTNASRQLEAGAYCAVRAHLGAFREQLEELVGDGVLTDREAYELRHASRLALSGSAYQEGDPEAYAPGVVGETRTVYFGGEEVEVVVIDGLATFNGDIILGFADELSQEPSGGPARAGVCHGCTRWSGSIGFGYADDWGDAATNAEMRQRIVRAVNHLRAVTGLQFEERYDGERVVFRNSMGCSSKVGRQVVTGIEPQYINLSTGCSWGSTAHEILHAIGVWHEHTRDDRDTYINVDFSLVPEGRENNWEQYGGSGTDFGPYDAGSIMHYPCGAEITTVHPSVSCSDMGQRDSLTIGDIGGTYRLYPPRFRIVGASGGEVSDRFTLSAVFEGEPPPDEFIEWDVIGRGVVATGPTFSTADVGLPNGDYTVFAYVRIVGEWVFRQWIDITIANTPPSVSLGPDREVELNRPFSVTATATDAEDGTCGPPVCSYAWDPDPVNDRGGVADYFASSVGARQISVTVTDGAGASASDDLTVTVVDSPPTPFITSPAAGSTFSSGAVVAFTGHATDANVGPGPDDGVLPCDRLHWTSSDLTDAIDPRDDCTVSVTFGSPGTRTIRLRATDPSGQMTTTSIAVSVEGCGASGCAPDVVLEFETEPDLDGSQYATPFTEPGYLIDTPITMKALVSDVDGPPTSISLEWFVRPPCFGGCSPFSIGTTGVFAPDTSYLTWTPSDDVVAWSNCVTVPLPYVVSVTATDTNGNARTVSRTIYLACDLI